MEIDINDNMHRIVGSKFFYGVLKSSTKHYTTKGVGVCLTIEIMIKPIKKKIMKKQTKATKKSD